jgi:hypothetical protein
VADALAPGHRIVHADLGEGVVLEPVQESWLRALFTSGERRVPLAAVRRAQSRAERRLRALDGSPERLRNVWLYRATTGAICCCRPRRTWATTSSSGCWCSC